MEKTLVLIKPDAVERNLIGDILSIYEKNGLKINSMKLLKASKNIVEKHYFEHRNKDFFNSVIEYITRSPIVVLILEGEDAINLVRNLNGPTDPNTANSSTIRGKYSLSKEENSVHASDSLENAKREISIWFGK